MLIYAPYYKRILSSLIDIIIFYCGLAYIYFFYPESFNLRVNSGAILLICICYHFYIYKTSNRTFGEHYLGLKTIFTKKVNHKNFLIFIRAVVISSVYFPLVFKEVSISFILGTLLLQFLPEIRAKKILIWDFFSNTVVIDEKKSSSNKGNNKSEKNETLHSDGRVQPDNHLIKKGKLQLISLFTCLILLEFYKVRFFIGGFEFEQALRKGFIFFYIFTLIFFIFKGFNWAKWVLGLSCFVFTFLLIPPAIFQIIGQLDNPSPIFSKVGTFIVTIGLPATLYIVMGISIIKSRSITSLIRKG